MKRPSFVVCQIGAREHYAMARTLHRAGLLSELITDIWVPSESKLARMPGRLGEHLRGRYHAELADAKVTHFTGAAIANRIVTNAFGTKDHWRSIIDQNGWFDSMVVSYLERSVSLRCRPPMILAYSYASRRILEWAKSAGAKAALSQIDGGQADEELIAEGWSAVGRTMPNLAPRPYWQSWREECRLADRIIVNSDWTRRLLLQAGLGSDISGKIMELPVVYEQPKSHPHEPHLYPRHFDTNRPLQVLFLGALTLRKGILETLRAMNLLGDAPVLLTLVGADAEGWCADYHVENVKVHGHVPRNRVEQFYRQADVFLFPTHSDGFGMTQIEALGFGLPVIASRNCASIVKHRVQGLLLDDVTPEAIADAIRYCVEHPGKLAEMSSAARTESYEFGERSSQSFLANLLSFACEENKTR